MASFETLYCFKRLRATQDTHYAEENRTLVTTFNDLNISSV